MGYFKTAEEQVLEFGVQSKKSVMVAYPPD